MQNDRLDGWHPVQKRMTLEIQEYSGLLEIDHFLSLKKNKKKKNKTLTEILWSVECVGSGG